MKLKNYFLFLAILFSMLQPCFLIAQQNVVCEFSNKDIELLSKAVCQVKFGTAPNQMRCSGILLNNENYDRKPYVLLSRHCITNNMLDVNLTTTEISDAESTAEFIFNYRSEFCSSDYPRVASQTFYDAKFRAAHFWTDFALLEIDPSNTLPPYLVYAGWDRADDATATLRNISHPSNKPQQIITGYKVTSLDPWKYNVNWSSAGGSSGSALINYNYKVVGNLSYGNTCSESSRRRGIMAPVRKVLKTGCLLPLT